MIYAQITTTKLAIVIWALQEHSVYLIWLPEVLSREKMVHNGL